MNRESLLNKLAMELGEWPSKWTDECRKAIPEISQWDLLGAKTFLSGSDGKRIEKTDWLQRRTELINKPSWDDAPEWAEWLAQDKRGEWCFYPALPERSDDMWINDEPKTGIWVDAHCRGCIPAGHDWRQTLERRPVFNESRADIIGQNGNDGDHYGARELNPTTSSLTNSQAREIAAEDGICSDGQPCGHPLTGDDAYCLGCPNVPVDETSTYCDRCGGEYWTPPHEYCPCLDMFRHNVEETFAPLPEKGRAGGLKFDANKPRMELLIQGMPRALEAVGQVLTFGAEKYAAHSWKQVEDNHNRYWAAKSRHELARAKGETHDPETGLLHLAHEACNALFLLELTLSEAEQ